ncbi:DUF4376 domain-containing protein [Novosphingobium aquae]|uniref:DUF4376 domain-containing protein n=1 Tax=Novosphingobium aquae TaxID=3133435 RepID=A0ABU8S3Z7_9SPHN
MSDPSDAPVHPLEIFELGPDNYWTGTSRLIEVDGGCPQGWTRTQPPPLEDGQFAIYDAPQWLITSEAWSAPAPSLDDLKTAQLKALADIRWKHEVGGTMVGGAPVPTDRESQAKLTSAYVLAAANPAFSLRWKIALGLFVTFDAATIINIGDAVGAYVRACFDREDELTTEILTAPDAEALAEIDLEDGWPE